MAECVKGLVSCRCYLWIKPRAGQLDATFYNTIKPVAEIMHANETRTAVCRFYVIISGASPGGK